MRLILRYTVAIKKTRHLVNLPYKAGISQDCLLGWLLPKNQVAAAIFSYYIKLLIYHP